MSLKGAVVAITGATAGVGRAVAREFAARGASVGLLARGRERLKDAQLELERLGVPALAVPTDVADAAGVEAAADEIESTLGSIDIWVNNAMTTVFSRFAEITPDEYRRATDVTYHGTVFGTMSALKRMLPRNRGTIVQVGSALAYRGIPLQAPYCGAKHAVRGFTDSLRCELLHERRNIHLTMVQLSAINTPQFEWCKTRLPRQPQPVPPIYQPEVAAQGVVWAAIHHPRELNVGWPATQVIAGNKIAPGLGDWYLGSTGYDSQQAAEAVDVDRASNLFEPVSGPYAARGRFSDRSRNSSVQLWLRTHRKAISLLAGAVVLGIAGVNATSSRRLR